MTECQIKTCRRDAIGSCEIRHYTKGILEYDAFCEDHLFEIKEKIKEIEEEEEGLSILW